MNKKGGHTAGILLTIFAFGLLFIGLIDYITDYLWFRELSYVGVFFTKLLTQIKLGLPVLIVVTLVMLFYLKTLKKGYFNKIESDEEANEEALKWVEILISLLSGIIIAIAVITKLWWKVLQFFNSTDFDIKDPVFGHDISFYIFKLDFIQQVNAMLIGIVIVFIVATFLYYSALLTVRTPKIFQTGDEDEDSGEYDYSDTYSSDDMDNDIDYSFDGPEIGDSLKGAFSSIKGFAKKRTKKKEPADPTEIKANFENNNLKVLFSIAQNHIIVLGVVLFLMVGLNFMLRQYDLLHGRTGVLYGAGYTDVNITLWVFRILMALSVVGAVLFAVGVKKKKMKMIISVPVIMIVVGLAGTGVATVVQNFIVSPDEINKERTYLKRNIEYTQSAYDLDKVNVKKFSANNQLTAADIANNPETINNIRINDFEPTEKFYNQTQAIRQYYTFSDADVDRYMINGEYTQVFLSAREIEGSKISQEWLNKHLKYTHGYGITLSRVDQVTSSGQPEMLIDSIPPVSQIDEIQIERPEIYFGELTNNYVLLNTDEKEFDYPDGSSNMYTTYEGNAGIKLNFINRLMFSIKEKSLKLLVSTNINSDSRIVINRNIKERVKRVMPYLAYDDDPYIVTVDGKLYWIIDAYTLSDNYPYSEPFGEETKVNYMRNSVKVVVDAYNGDVDYYVVDDNDPIAKTMQKIFPTLFKDGDKMPEKLREHIRYPNMLFQIQASIYSRYHMNDVNVFYQSEDLWDISNQIYGTEETVMTPNYFIMKLPGESSAEFVNILTYTPKDKDNLMSLLVARNDGDNYGELVLYQLPKSKTVYGPMQIEAQIDQNTEISKEFSLWNSSGSTYTRGDMFVIPIEDSFIYVEPVYLEATNSSIPEMKRVIVAYNDRIVYEPTLDEALVELFGAESGHQPAGPSTTPGDEPGSLTKAELIKLANEAFYNAQEAQKGGNWAQYGEHLKTLENYLNQLAAQ